MYSIDGKKHLMEVKWANERLTVDHGTNGELTVVSPKMTDPTNKEADTTQPITGLENSLRVDTLTENKTLVSELEPVSFFFTHESRGVRS